MRCNGDCGRAITREGLCMARRQAPQLFCKAGRHTAQLCNPRTACIPVSCAARDAAALPVRCKARTPCLHGVKTSRLNCPASHKHMALQCFVYAVAISHSMKGTFNFVEIGKRANARKLMGAERARCARAGSEYATKLAVIFTLLTLNYLLYLSLCFH